MSISASLFRAALKSQVWMYRATGGRLASMGGNLLVLTTTGRKSGKERTVPLLGLEEGEGFIVAASAGGAPSHPAWYLNLQRTPSVTVQRGKEVREMIARTAGPAERPQLWSRFLTANKGFAKYEERTDREIPVVILEPR